MLAIDFFNYQISTMKRAEPLSTTIFVMQVMVQNLFTLHCTGDLPCSYVMMILKSFNLFPVVHQCDFECFMLKG